MTKKQKEEHFNELAMKIAAKAAENMIKSATRPMDIDMYWSLEKAIFRAMVYAESLGEERAKAQYLKMLKEFDSQDGQSQN